jgi:hypothetical protein
MKHNIYLRVIKDWFQFEGAKPHKGQMLNFEVDDEGWCREVFKKKEVWHEVIQHWLDEGWVVKIKYEDMYEDCSIPVDWDAIDPEYIKSLQ